MKKFDPVNVSSKFAICGLPIRVDTYKTCSFGCKYCFSNNRVIMEFEKSLQVGDIESVKRRLSKIFDENTSTESNFLNTLIKDRITWHCGGMSDPFQPCERKFGITKQLVDVTNEYDISILFSTKADTVYDANIRPELHTFQLSVTNVDDRVDIEPNVPSIMKRKEFYDNLKSKGYRVGIRIQPFIPTISTLDIIKTFKDADNFTIEGIKLVPQNEEQKQQMIELLGLSRSDFTQKGLLTLLPEIRLKAYGIFIDYMNKNNITYSISDNDLRRFSTNNCCCGDRLITKASGFDTTAMIMKYGDRYSKEQIDDAIKQVAGCTCNSLFTSNRQEGCKTVQEFYDKRFGRASSPFSPKYQYFGNGLLQLSMVDKLGIA